MKTIKTIAMMTILNALIIIGFILGSSSNVAVVTVGDKINITPTITVDNTVTPTNNLIINPSVAIPSVTAKPVTPKPACVVMISGKKYDVSQLRNTHSGGNIFTCSTDMTNTFFSQHNQSMLNSTMLKYLIN